MSRDEDIEAIIDRGRATRTRAPRVMWIAALAVGAICGIGFLILLLAAPDPAHATVVQRSAAGSGLGIGLVIGACAGIVIGCSIARQRGAHSSRNNP